MTENRKVINYGPLFLKFLTLFMTHKSDISRKLDQVISNLSKMTKKIDENDKKTNKKLTEILNRIDTLGPNQNMVHSIWPI